MSSKNTLVRFSAQKNLKSAWYINRNLIHHPTGHFRCYIMQKVATLFELQRSMEQFVGSDFESNCFQTVHRDEMSLFPAPDFRMKTVNRESGNK